MTLAARAFSFSNIHTAYKQEVSRVWFLKALLRLFYDLFSCVLSYIKQVTLSNSEAFSAWAVINLVTVIIAFINPFTTTGPFLMPICDFPLERAAPCLVSGILPCSHCYNHSDTTRPNPAGAKSYLVVTLCTLHHPGTKAIAFSVWLMFHPQEAYAEKLF